jgi:hypothetical protein
MNLSLEMTGPLDAVQPDVVPPEGPASQAAMNHSMESKAESSVNELDEYGLTPESSFELEDFDSDDEDYVPDYSIATSQSKCNSMLHVDSLASSPTVAALRTSTPLPPTDCINVTVSTDKPEQAPSQTHCPEAVNNNTHDDAREVHLDLEQGHAACYRAIEDEKLYIVSVPDGGDAFL